MLENYIINENTLVLIPIDNNQTKVIELKNSYVISKNVQVIVDESCKFYGSSFIGRCQGTEFLTGFKYKCPIIISEIKNIILFPTSSFRTKKCLWFNYNSIFKYYQKNNTIYIELLNQEVVEIAVSLNIFNNQLFKASRLNMIMKNKNQT